ncbi:4Fe-4S dicluster domain-containing protein [Ensifer sp. HO-A22]|uniref:4Fe-4S dicluster domain-containing protein n=1 Tax=Ensifer oleiphilus TaxID=2742698 RepID=A0A7Y6Q4G3_9HYPH|nr:4Fe-4S dicluster domain-containing protein [Ensifer oleiphilus]NVD38884.1 4Fe-4S dicluster domain-containing protein [Ensifer oleiphilus]
MTAPSAKADTRLETIRAALEPHGLFLRGTLNFASGDAGPLLADGRPAASVALIGNIGGSLWQPFVRWRKEALDRGGADPLDTWSKAVIGEIARTHGATAYFPSDRPWQPFQQWAMRAEGLKASTSGILIHPRYGLWHGYRGALAFDMALPADGERWAAHPCDSCVEKPCVSACPAGALEDLQFNVGRCRSHLRTEAGRNGCLKRGCLSRDACPIGRDYRYSPDQLHFHMAALEL